MVIYTSNEGYITGVWVGQAERNGAFQGTGDWPEYKEASQLGDDGPASGGKKRNASGPKSP
jgi:hypothetical protein